MICWKPCDGSLDAAVQGLTEAQRLRLLMAHDGRVHVERTALAESRPLNVAVAGEPIDPRSVWLYHKTTQRGMYNAARSLASGHDDVILWNPLHEVTEATTANVVAELQGRRVTPPVSCGLLAGTFRAELLARGEIQERVVTLDDLRSAPRLWLINSVHEWRAATVDFGSV